MVRSGNGHLQALTANAVNKKRILEHVRTVLANRLSEAIASHDSLLKDRDGESKSSVGDKYETGREMIQAELERSARYIEEIRSQINLIEDLTDQTLDTVQLGALVTTNHGKFLLSTSIGRVDLDGDQVFLISPVSPIASTLLDKKRGDQVTLNGREYRILSVS